MNEIIKAPLSGIISGYPLKNRVRNDEWREKRERGKKKRKEEEERRIEREEEVMIVPIVLLQLTSLYTASSVR